MMESITVHVFLRNRGISLLGRSTLTELVNAVRNETRSLVLDAQVGQALGGRMLRVGTPPPRVGLTAFAARPLPRLLAAMDTLAWRA